MTRKLVIVNMSNWADEAYDIERTGPHGVKAETSIRPGEYAIVHTPDTEKVMVTPCKLGEGNGYEPPTFPEAAIRESQET